ncbi:GNAT family N-acetyltransferase [Bryobacter aggregatus]|uniref:GNAT family N-acetyltransferase n=1 Tax=Bryobacter aggregatus TaxID=360054 RepID=UPI0004E0D165|nr:GNAT family N-acetyltransferase [Bryobacter aggregatus]
MIQIRQLSAQDRGQIPRLAEILIDCVDGGASVSFLAPLSQEKALRFFDQVFHEIETGVRLLLVASTDGILVGTVQAVVGLAENQPHRAEISKLLVHRKARGQGVASALMEAIERAAAQAGKTLLVLDTAVGGGAESLYDRLGYTRTGMIPGFALMPDGTPCGTAIYWKAIAYSA